MNFVFEDINNNLNFKNCRDINPSTIRRFGTSSFAMKIIRNKQGKKIDIENRPNHYIIPASVNHSPNDWAKEDGCLSYLNEKQLIDLRSGRALVMLDQTLEGYQTEWLWEYLHNDCYKNKVNPASIIYVTGNLLSHDQYNKWANDNKVAERILVIPHPIFEHDVFEISEETLNVSYDNNLEYKKNKLLEIKDYNCLQKRLRAHRIWFYNLLYKEQIIDNGLLSMNPYDYKSSYLEGRWISFEDSAASSKILPLLIYGKNNNEKDDNYYIRRITDQVFKDTWVSVISEASFADSDGTLFLSEKIFKPIACMHPFIIVGNRNSLRKLQEMGYKTFDGFIDESYDNLPTFERFDAIIKSIKKVIDIQDKLSWFESMKDILIHNYNTLKNNSTKKSPAEQILNSYYYDYFKL